MRTQVVAALIWDKENRFMICQRPANKTRAFQWEFVGGKAEKGETLHEALVRECREELALQIEGARIVDSVVHEYPEKTIRLTLIECNPQKGSVPQALEHQQIRWVTVDEMKSINFCPADQELVLKVFGG